MPKKITVFTTNTCTYCGMIKRYLKYKGLNYDEVNIEENPERREEAYSKSGVFSVPVTLITKEDDTEEVIVGYNISRLAPAIA